MTDNCSNKIQAPRSASLFPRRVAGILLHPTSLPGPYGIGCIGEQARRFVDYLIRAGQSLWQVLPLGPTGFCDSPYAAFCSVAGNPLLIDVEELVREGDLRPDDLIGGHSLPSDTVDYGAVIRWKTPLLRKAARQFLKGATSRRRAAYDDFCDMHAAWIDEYALFMALKDRFERQAADEGVWGATWNRYWDKDIALREPAALRRWRGRLGDSIEIHKTWQFYFFQQWHALRQYANERGVRLIGDMPIYVASDSADVWVARDLFLLDEQGREVCVAGVPPDYFSVTGQRWGNPLYDWQAMAKQDFVWWIQRFRHLLELVDIIRVDHFRGFEAYWTIPEVDETAAGGHWATAPGRALFSSVRRRLGELPLIAEDLGLITPEVEALRDEFNLPGMRVLQFGFEANSPASPHLPHNHVPNCVAYTGTHDNDTSRSWFNKLSIARQYAIKRYFNCSLRSGAWALVRSAMASVARAAVIPMQDVLDLGNEARMNTPSTTGGNWKWRLKPNYAAASHADRLTDLTNLYGRATSERSPSTGGDSSFATHCSANS